MGDRKELPAPKNETEARVADEARRVRGEERGPKKLYESDLNQALADAHGIGKPRGRSVTAAERAAAVRESTRRDEPKAAPAPKTVSLEDRLAVLDGEIAAMHPAGPQRVEATRQARKGYLDGHFGLSSPPAASSAPVTSQPVATAQTSSTGAAALSLDALQAAESTGKFPRGTTSAEFRRRAKERNVDGYRALSQSQREYFFYASERKKLEARKGA
jgi:hypothetical protein